MFRALALRQSDWRRAKARNVSFEILYGGQFTLSTELIILNYPTNFSNSIHATGKNRRKKTAPRKFVFLNKFPDYFSVLLGL